MQRLLRILIGPELYWVVVYLVFRWLAARNVPPTEPGNIALNSAVWLMATVGVTLSFALLAVPKVNRWILFARLAITAFIGVNACSIVACDAIKYPEPGRDSGLLGLWIMAVIVGGIVWCVCAGISLLVLRLKSAAVPPAIPS
jgi:hypothetical protein